MNPDLAIPHLVSSPDEEAEERLGIERPFSLGRIVVEILFYVTFASSLFGGRLGLASIPYLLGGIVACSGLISFIISCGIGERIPMTVWFAIIINIGANFSQVFANGQTPVLGEGLITLIHWLSFQTMACFLVQNRSAQKRVLLFIAATTILALVLGGQGVKHGRSDRLAAEEFAMMGNPNSVAYICGFLCVTLLFWSLRSAKSFRPILWLLSAVLAYFTFRSVSRVGIVILGFGLLMLLITILSARGARTGGLVMLLIAFVALWQFAFMFSESFDMLERRLGSERRNTESRTKLYNLSTLGDLASATPFGFGPRGSTLTSTGITAHNTFVYTYMAYGAIAAWPYLIWVIILGVRVVRLMRARDLPADTRLMVFTLFSMIMAEHLTNNVGFAEITAVVGTAVVDKYTRPYSARAMAQRELEGMEELPAYSDGRPAVQYY